MAATVPAVGAALLVGHFSTSGIGSGGRSLREVSHYSATGLDFVTRHPRHGLESFVFLGWLTPLLALAGLVLLLRARRFGLAAALAIGALVPALLALGTHFPLYSPLWHHFAPLRYPRVPERLMPVACLAVAALVAFAVARVRWLALVAALLVLVAADLRVSVYEAAAAEPGKRAYAGLTSQGGCSSCRCSTRTSTWGASTSGTTRSHGASGPAATRRSRHSPRPGSRCGWPS